MDGTLHLYDVQIKTISISRKDIVWLTLIVLISVLSLYLNILLLIPYAIFLATYALRIFLASRRLNYVGTVFGILAYVILFAVTINSTGPSGLLLVGALLIYMVGSEFTVRAKISGRKPLLLYDVIPPFTCFLNPAFIVFSLSLLTSSHE